MLQTLDKTYNIGLDNFYDVLEPRSKDKMVKLVLVSAQKCLLCLGDLARYKEQVQVDKKIISKEDIICAWLSKREV
jgi:CO dehydrogenase/acetyl-CoA synthase epsilon subunit